MEPIAFENKIPPGGHSDHNLVQSFDDDVLPSCDLLRKTYENFQNGKYQTLISRFHTNTDSSKSQTDPTQTANTKQFGMSHGRNLLKLNPTTHNTYDNPYCRVWTAHHQYAYHTDTIRPFDMTSQEELENVTSNGKGNSFRVTSGSGNTSNFDSGSKRLDNYGVLNPKNGLVTIAPTARLVDYFNGTVDDKNSDGHMSPKRCMFSIENLAWKDKKLSKSEFDEKGLSPEQKGPLGGRIMWFPPYNLKFSEDVSVDWNGNQFIGRGEKVYTYSNTERRGNLSFTLLIDHPSLVDYWSRKNGNGIELDSANDGGVDNKNNEENTLLRFFAGCDVLYTKRQTYQKRVEPQNEEEKKEDVLTPEPLEVASPTPRKIVCVLYYPNNYSGMDDRSDNNAIKYLMNGVGTNKYVDNNKNAVDMPFDTTRKVTVNSTQVGGYEMRQGITLDYGVDEALANSYKTIEKTYADITSRERKAQLLTNSSGSPIQAHVNGQFSYVSYIDPNMVIIEGEKYEISYEPLGDSFARYVSFIINNGAVKVSETTLLEGELTVYGENGNDVTYHLSDYSDGFEIKAYIKSDNSFQCKTNGMTITSFSIVNPSGYTNYYCLDKVGYAQILASQSGTTWSHGWRPLKTTDKEYLLSTIATNYTKGNNPHNGNMAYDNGSEYFKYFKQLFKYAYENDMFDERCYANYPIYKEKVIKGIGFNITDEAWKDSSKVRFFGKYYYKSGTTSSECEDTTSSQSGDTILSESLVSDIYGSGYTKTEQVMNTKRMKITFRLREASDKLCELKYYDTIVMNYLTRMIPSTCILEVEYTTETF